MPTKLELEDRITELKGENQTLNDKLDSILDIAVANGDSADEELDADDMTDEDELSEEDGDELPAIRLSDDEEAEDLDADPDFDDSEDDPDEYCSSSWGSGGSDCPTIPCPCSSDRSWYSAAELGNPSLRECAQAVQRYNSPGPL